MKRYKLTPAQSRVLDFVKQHIKGSGFPPTRAEISAGLGYASPNAAQEHLAVLEHKGCISLTPGISRGIKVL